MVISSNRSPSPISSSKTNLNNPRTPVSNNNLRKSFSRNPLNNPSFVRNSKNFNPTTPANTPTEFSQRNSLLNEYKENEKNPNLKPVKIRSSSPITKHFMAPTISTVSKIAAPSPRKKILGERNEPVRVSDDRKLSFAEKIQSCSDSVSCSQVLPPKVSTIENHSFTEIFESGLGLASGSQLPSKTLESNMSSISDPIENPIFEIKESLHSSVTGENQLKPDDNSVVTCLMEENPSKNSVPELVKPSCSSPVPVLAPLDLDPSLPPYDPKTNILSPRPLFLCYKPNPRVEAYRTKGTKLDDICTASESCSDDTKNTEETECSVESEDVALSEEVVSEAVLEQMQEKNENIVCKKMSRQRTFVRTKIIPSLLVFVVACLCFTVTDSPVYNDDSSFEFGTSAMEMSPIDIVYNWVEMSASYLSMLNFMPKGVDTMIPFNVANLTMVNNEYRTRGYGENAIEEMQGMNGLGSQEEMETNEEVNQEEESFLAVKSEDLADLDPGMIKESAAIHEKDGIEIPQHKEESVSPQSSEVVDAKEKSEAKMTEEEVNQEEVVETDDKSENLADHDPEMIKESVAIHEQDGIELPQQYKAESVSSQSSEVVDAEEKSEAKLTEESFLAVETDDKSEDLADLDPGMIKESAAIHEKDGIEIPQHKEESVSPQSSEVVDAKEKSEAKMTEEEVNQEEVVETDDKSENLADHDPEMIKESVAIHEQDGIELPQQYKAESVSSQSSEVVDAEEKSEAKLTEESCLLAAMVEEKMEEFAELEPEMIEESVEFLEKDGIDIQRDTDAADLKLTQHASESDSSQSSEIDEASPHDLSLGTLESVIHDLADKSLKQTVMQISLVLLSLISGAAFLYMRSKKASTLEPVETLQPKKLVSSSTSTSIDSKRPQIERFCSQNWEIEEEMVAGHSGPSGMSSDFQNSSSCKDRESERENEVQSSQGRPISRNLDVESSSNYSVGSVSYGSFTTYEKLHNKHGYGDEVVTPVRHSNRIRNKIVSP
ncbi:uncharacterized protein LOC113331734 isoform X1 [Papaver somniferum]|uniref:uncharacterized protein LOC113331734 isoform X1 n=1 Tax=Papaver somniferum TaxID=3469 RepID=UPI000E6FE4E2|nr:uncharacterized protein LOC113331734 isoform X1 [Papaver somniferum]